MVGLRNQGATCYLNSLLQSLYFTNAFRKVRKNLESLHKPTIETDRYPRLYTKYRLTRKLRARTVRGLSKDFSTTCRQVKLLSQPPSSPHPLAGNLARFLNSKMYRSFHESLWNDWSTK